MKNKYSVTSIILSITSIIIIIYINYDLAIKYINADLKTRYLFEVKELGTLFEKVIPLLITFTALILIRIAILKKEDKLKSFIAILLALISTVLIFVRFWFFIVQLFIK